MLPLDPGILMLLKFFVVITCVSFWVELVISMWKRARRHRMHHSHGGRRPPDSAN
jgi:hypothetical protein